MTGCSGHSVHLCPARRIRTCLSLVCTFVVLLVAFDRYAMFSYKDALLSRTAALRKRGGAGSDSDNEHHIAELF